MRSMFQLPLFEYSERIFFIQWNLYMEILSVERDVLCKVSDDVWGRVQKLLQQTRQGSWDIRTQLYFAIKLRQDRPAYGR